MKIKNPQTYWAIRYLFLSLLAGLALGSIVASFSPSMFITYVYVGAYTWLVYATYTDFVKRRDKDRG